MKAVWVKLKLGHHEPRGEFHGDHHVGSQRQEIAIRASPRLC
jgi:hypothetical protein